MILFNNSIGYPQALQVYKEVKHVKGGGFQLFLSCETVIKDDALFCCRRCESPDHYLGEARRLKHQADALVCIQTPLLLRLHLCRKTRKVTVCSHFSFISFLFPYLRRHSTSFLGSYVLTTRFYIIRIG